MSIFSINIILFNKNDKNCKLYNNVSKSSTCFKAEDTKLASANTGGQSTYQQKMLVAASQYHEI